MNGDVLFERQAEILALPIPGTGPVTLSSAVKQLIGTSLTSPRPALFTCSQGRPISGPGSWRNKPREWE